MPGIEKLKFDQGEVLVFGSRLFMKMMDNPSAKYDKQGRVFSGTNQDVVGISYFHAKIWCLLSTLESGGEFKYDLPTHLQYEYVARHFPLDVQIGGNVWQQPGLDPHERNFSERFYGLHGWYWTANPHFGRARVQNYSLDLPGVRGSYASFSPVVVARGQHGVKSLHSSG